MKKKPGTDATLAALGRAVLESPGDDTPRLVYADRLDELSPGGPRAAYIRAQCALARLKPWDEGFVETELQCAQLDQRFGTEWNTPGLARELHSGQEHRPREFRPFVRGFPDQLWANASRFGEKKRAALAKYPIGELVLETFYPENIEDLPRIVAESRAAKLVLPYVDDARWVQLLALGPLQPHLRHLALGFGRPVPYLGIEPIGAQTIEQLVTSPAFSNLEGLVLSHLNEDALLVVARHTSLPKLRHLRLNGPFTGTVAAAFAAAKWTQQLEHLTLDGHDRDSEGYPFADIDVVPLFASKYLRNVRRLELTSCGFYTDIAAALAKATALGPLDEFLTEDWEIDLPPAVFRNLARAPALAGVKSLRLEGSTEPDEAARHLARFRELRHLEWDEANLSAAGAAALAGLARTLRRLVMRNLHVTAAIAKALCDGPAWPHLAELSAEHSQSDGAAVATLIDHPNFARLVSLDIGGEKGAAELMKRLAASQTAGRFRKLRLNYAVTDAQLKAVLASPHVARVGHLALPAAKGITSATRSRFERVFGYRLLRDS